MSYASRDRERALDIVSRIECAGIQVWIDRQGIAGGLSYGPEIVAAIQSCAVLVLLCSEAALQSRNVKQEIQLAWKYQRPYLPLLLEPVTIPTDLEYWLEGSQWIEIGDLQGIAMTLDRWGVFALERGDHALAD